MKKEITTPLVSVVMCTYNTEKYIAEAIDSVLNQTYSNFEFIIWDDGSTDGTRAIVESFRDERIRYFFHENTGLGMALKLSCEQARGKYIARMDADDVSLPYRFQMEFDFLETHPDYVLVSSSYNIIDKNGNKIGRTFSYSWDYVIRKILKKGSCIAHPCTMFSREAYIESGGYLPIRNGQDRVLWPKLLRYGKVYNITEPLLNYRLLDDSISHLADNSPYKEILEPLRRKIANDEIVDDEDVQLLNTIYTLEKRSVKRTNNRLLTSQRNTFKRKDIVIYGYLSKVLGHKVAQNTIIFIKNIIAIFRF